MSGKSQSFGIIITCYVGDYFLTKGLLASINTFMPHIPICIIQDGDFSIEAERRVYNITNVIKKAGVKNDFLRENCFGSRCTNMIAFWESPFERFLYIDSDTIVRGDVTKNFNSTKYDFIHNIPHEEYTDFVIKHQYFNFEKLFTIIPEIAFRNHHFFNAGVFVATRGIFDLELFKELLAIWKTDKKLFGPEPQGFINYMVFRLVEEQKITVGEATLQTLVPMFDKPSLEKMFYSQEIEQPTIVHWAGMKPLYINRNKVYSRIALHYRKQNLRDKKSIAVLCSTLFFQYEEYKNLLRIYFKGSIRSYIQSKAKQVYVLKYRAPLQRIRQAIFRKNIDQKLRYLETIESEVFYPCVKSTKETSDLLLQKNTSFASFDFEAFNLCFDESSRNQKYDKELRYRLRNILLQTNNNHCLLAIPDFKDNLTHHVEIENWFNAIRYLKEILSIESQYFNSKIELKTIKKLWDNRAIVIIKEGNSLNENEKELFSNSSSISIINKKVQNAWSEYNPIQKEIITATSKLENAIVILQLGIISSILAYDLSKLGIQTIDMSNKYSSL